MDWEQLAQGKCPMCASALENTGSSLSPYYHCESNNCTFKIGGTRFDEITADMEKPKPRKRHFLSDNMMQPDMKVVAHDDDEDYFD